MRGSVRTRLRESWLLLVLGDVGDELVADLGPTYTEVPDQDGVRLRTDGITTLVVADGVAAFVAL